MFIVSKNKNHRFCLNLERIEAIRCRPVKDIWHIEVSLLHEGEKTYKTITFSFNTESEAQDAFNEMMDLIPEEHKYEKSEE